MNEIQDRPWRAEKVLIYFEPRQSALRLNKDSEPAGDWIVAEPRKIVSKGQEIVWQALGPCEKLDLVLPDDVCNPPKRISDCTMSATVKDDAPIGLQFYEAFVNGTPATGGSSPGLIIDP
jgi:hypothetical protein